MTNVVDLFRGKATPPSPTPPAEPRFACQETRPQSGGRWRGTFAICLFLIVGIMPVTAIHPWLGVAFTVWMCAIACYFTLFGMPGFYRVADCLDCGTQIQIQAQAKGTNCEGCQRRIVLKKDQLLYV